MSDIEEPQAPETNPAPEASSPSEQEDTTTTTTTTKKKWSSTLLAATGFGILLLVGGIIVYLMERPPRAATTRPPTSSPTLPPAAFPLEDCESWDCVLEHPHVDPAFTTRLAGYNIFGSENSGTLPTEIGLFTALTYLHVELFSATAASTLPSEVGLLSNLETLRFMTRQRVVVEENKHVIIPTELGRLENVRELFLMLISSSDEESKSSAPAPKAVLPTEIFELPSVKYFQVLGNFAFSENLPTRLPPAATDVWLRSVRLNSAFPLNWILHLEASSAATLTSLTLTDVGLTGTLPSELAGLQSLDLDGESDLTGSLPSELFDLNSKLERLLISRTNVTGTLPTRMETTSLTSLYLGSNKLYGPIPSEIGQLSALESLVLFGNKFTGAIPTEIASIPYLENLVLEHNALSGTLPTELASLNFLDDLSLRSNFIQGSIPTEYGNFARFLYLDVSQNRLTGTIPSDLGSIGAKLLRLGHNQLTGTIPTELGGITTIAGNSSSPLAFLSINDCSIEGTIPTELATLKDLISLDLSNNLLSGDIPTNLGSGGDFFELLLSGNANLTGTIPSRSTFTNSTCEVSVYSSLYVPNQTIVTCDSLPIGGKILDIRGTALEGPVPKELCDLDKIKTDCDIECHCENDDVCMCGSGSDGSGPDSLLILFET